MSRKGRSPIVASDFGASPVTLLSRVPAPPQRTMASVTLGIDFAPVISQRLVVCHFRFVHGDVAASARKCEGNAEKILQALPDRLFSLGGHVKKHETPTAGTQKLAAQCTGAQASVVNFVDAGIRDPFGQRSFYLPPSVQQFAKFVQR